MCRHENSQTIFPLNLFVIHVNQYKIMFYGQIPLQKASNDQTKVMSRIRCWSCGGEYIDADFYDSCIAASLIKNYNQLKISVAVRSVLITNIHVSVIELGGIETK